MTQRGAQNTRQQNWCCRFDGHCLKEKECFAPFIKRKSFFLFMHASSPIPLETSGSFFRFNSFLFIYSFFFLFNFFNLFIRSLQVYVVEIPYPRLKRPKNLAGGSLQKIGFGSELRMKDAALDSSEDK